MLTTLQPFLSDSGLRSLRKQRLEKSSEEIQQGHLCTSADPRRIGAGGGETIILSPEELRKAITFQQSIDDQSIWLTTAQAGIPLTMDKEERVNSKDAQMGRTTARHLHPVEEWSQKHITDPKENPVDPLQSSILTPSWELDPPPLMANHPLPDYGLQHQNHTTGRLSSRAMPNK